ncbi:hypothetical protein HK097_003942 [Rhizophlyctis rosea]|uniref:Carbohydrate kinase PfkB domain-containing protein n=1 Tax=Rhizophlyctis rosea TaxID=64517 RepID=A0AAD5SFP4_9FUNG|nr:hypothetical protein HK097_003942 [Rhizophlyctis rosea]
MSEQPEFPEVRDPSETAAILECKEVLIVGLNPAFQTTLYFDNYRQGKVNRAYRKSHSIGGKGQNVAMACEQHGEKDKVSILQFIGGMTGSYIQRVLDEKGIHQISVPVAKGTRTCTTVLDKRTGEMTELIEPAGRVGAEERELLEKWAVTLLKDPKLEAIALCGSLPPGITGSTYTLIAENKPEKCVLLLDACSDVDCLKTGKVDILKINSEEAAVLAGMAVTDPEDLLSIGKHLIKTRKIKILAITNGPDTAYLFDTTRHSSSKHVLITEYHLPPLVEVLAEEREDKPFLPLSTPPMSRSLPEATGMMEIPLARVESGNDLKALWGKKEILLNPLGAGDTCSGVFLLEFMETMDAAQAFRYGLAAASASCLIIDHTSHFDPPIMHKIFDAITYEQFEEPL